MGKGLRLQPAQQACFMMLISSTQGMVIRLKFYLYTLLLWLCFIYKRLEQFGMTIEYMDYLKYLNYGTLLSSGSGISCMNISQG